MVKIVPSVASADQMSLLGELRRIPQVPWLHLDIEDGNFVPNITFGLKTIQGVCRNTKAQTDVHLMVANPYSYIDALLDCGVFAIAAHLEALCYPAQFLHQVKKGGAMAGLAINFKVDSCGLAYYADQLDYILIMTGEPDGEGQRFNPVVLHKISKLRELLPPHISIWADGGIGANDLSRVVNAGADTIVMGRAIWQAPDPQAEYNRLSYSI